MVLYLLVGDALATKTMRLHLYHFFFLVSSFNARFYEDDLKQTNYDRTPFRLRIFLN